MAETQLGWLCQAYTPEGTICNEPAVTVDDRGLALCLDHALEARFKGDFRFRPKACKAGGLSSTFEAKLLRFLFVSPRSKREMQSFGGVTAARALADRGLVRKESELWHLTPAGKRVLAQAAGISLLEVSHA